MCRVPDCQHHLHAVPDHPVFLPDRLADRKLAAFNAATEAGDRVKVGRIAADLVRLGEFVERRKNAGVAPHGVNGGNAASSSLVEVGPGQRPPCPRDFLAGTDWEDGGTAA